MRSQDAALSSSMRVEMLEQRGARVIASRSPAVRLPPQRVAPSTIASMVADASKSLLRELSVCAARDRSTHTALWPELLDAQGLLATRRAEILLALSRELRAGRRVRWVTTLALYVSLPLLHAALPRVFYWRERPRDRAAWMQDVLLSAVETLHSLDLSRDPTKLSEEFVRATLNRCRAIWRAESRHDRLLRRIEGVAIRADGASPRAIRSRTELAADRLASGGAEEFDASHAMVLDQVQSWIRRSHVSERDARLFAAWVLDERLSKRSAGPRGSPRRRCARRVSASRRDCVGRRVQRADE